MFGRNHFTQGLLASVAISTSFSVGVAYAETPGAGVQAQSAPSPDARAERRARREQRAEARRRAKAAREAQRAAAASGADERDVVVVGIRGSVASARNKKRNAKQIVDAIVSEDAGKLPDNNVPEALARVAGVNIERYSGRGQNITIRGLSGVQTTINGKDAQGAPGVFAGSNESSVGSGRAMNLADLPADLIKSVEVYKTRTADQIDGGIAGTVNIELRRPLDLKKGITVAGSAKGGYVQVGDLWSPQYSGLVGARYETGVGELGFLVNGAYSKNRWYDVVIDSESPSAFRDQTRDSLPQDLRDRLIVPYKVKDIVRQGVNEQKSLSAVAQWAPTPELSFVLEGNYVGNNGSSRYASYEMRLRDFNYTVTNPQFNDKGGVTSITLSNPTSLALNTFAGYGENNSDNYQANFETHWRGGIARIDLALTYNKNNADSLDYSGNLSYPGVTSARIDLNSDAVPGGGPFITAAGLDPSNPDSARVGGFHDLSNLSGSDQYAAQLDMTLDFGADKFLRSFKTGYRFSTQTNQWTYGYRDAFFEDEANRPRIIDVPGLRTVIQTPQVEGGSKLSFASFDTREMVRNWDAVRQFIIRTPDTGFWVGGGSAKSLEDAWGPAVPGGERGSGGDSREGQFSAYVMADYGFRLGVPIDGNVGLRYVNTWGDTFGIDSGTRPVRDRNGDIIRYEEFSNTTRNRGNNSDLLPSAYLTAHFTDRLQLRLAYSYNVQRPSFWDLRSTIELNAQNFRGSGGNPKLQPLRTTDYNASLEWYFNALGSITLNGFIKKQTGFIFWLPARESIPGYDTPFVIYRPRNAGAGEVRGVEAAATTSFDFVDSSLKPFGITANFTYLPKADQEQPVYGDNDTFTYITARAATSSKYSYNLIGFFDVGWLSTRVAYNWRSSYRAYLDIGAPQWVPIFRPISRLDAAINYTPYKFLTFTIEAQNLTSAKDRRYFGEYDIPVGLLQQGRTIQGGVRFRF